MDTKEWLAIGLAAGLVGGLYLMNSERKSTQKGAALEARVATEVSTNSAAKNYTDAESESRVSARYEERPLYLRQRDTALVERVNRHYESMNVDVDAFTPNELIAFVVKTGASKETDIEARNDVYALVEKARIPGKFVRERTQDYLVGILREFRRLEKKGDKQPEDENRYEFLRNEMRKLTYARVH